MITASVLKCGSFQVRFLSPVANSLTTQASVLVYLTLQSVVSQFLVVDVFCFVPGFDDTEPHAALLSSKM